MRRVAGQFLAAKSSSVRTSSAGLSMQYFYSLEIYYLTIGLVHISGGLQRCYGLYFLFNQLDGFITTEVLNVTLRNIWVGSSRDLHCF